VRHRILLAGHSDILLAEVNVNWRVCCHFYVVTGQCSGKAYELIFVDHYVAIQARTGPLNDPLLSQRRCRTAEVGAIYRCETGNRLRSADIERLQLPQLPLRPAGRHGTDWPVWQTMHVNDIESTTRQSSRYTSDTNIYIVVLIPRSVLSWLIQYNSWNIVTLRLESRSDEF
jgi:hypothetical protein